MQFLEFKLAHLLGLEFSHSKYCLGVQATPLKIHRTVGSFTKSIEAGCRMSNVVHKRQCEARRDPVLIVLQTRDT